MKEIRSIIEMYDRLKDTDIKMALASVVNVEASSYRRIGARMLVCSDGNWIGGISGGCLEGDALKRSQQAIYKNEPSSVVYDTMDDENNQIGVGLGCNGRIEVLFIPIDVNDESNPIEQLRQVVAADRPMLMLKIIESDESSLLGKSELLDDSLATFDFFGIEKSQLNQLIQDTKRKQRPQVSTFQIKSGAVKVLVEFIRPETKLVLVGHNYDVNAFVGIAHELGWEIHIVGDIRKFSKDVYTKSKKVIPYKDHEKVPIDEFTAVVLMTHDYNWDKTMLPYFLKAKPSYIGMLGPKKRMQKMQNELGLEELDSISFFHSPVGLDIGAESPEEIALAIAGEIVAVLRNREGKFLKDRDGSIH